MSVIARLRDFTSDRDATPPIPISAQGIDDELDQIIVESNVQDGRITTLEAPGNVGTGDLEDDCVTPEKASFMDDSVVATDGHILVGDGNDFGNVLLSGDVTVTNTGVTTVVDGAITTSRISDGAITTSKLSADCVVSAKVADNSLMNSDINTSANIAATKIHDGSISNAEYGYLNGVTSSIQTQINNISSGAISNVQDNVFRICDDLDNTKDIAFQSSAITTGNVRTITMADQDIDLAPTTGTYATECFKNITDGSNVIVAGQARDTLTLTGTGGTTVTNTPGTDTVTINSQVGASVGLVLALG